MSANDEAVARSLLALAEAGIPTDIQELLLRGNPMKGVAPGALHKALAAYTLGSAGGDDAYMPLTEEQKAGMRARAEAAVDANIGSNIGVEAYAEIDSALADIPTLLCALAAAEKRAEEAEKELQVAMKRLSNPNAVYINMVRSVIAKPSVSQLEHVYQGELTTERDSLRAEVERLKEERGKLTVFDWAYTDRKTGEQRYAGSPEKVERLAAAGVVLLPVYTVDAALTKKEPSDGQG